MQFGHFRALSTKFSPPSKFHGLDKSKMYIWATGFSSWTWFKDTKTEKERGAGERKRGSSGNNKTEVVKNASLQISHNSIVLEKTILCRGSFLLVAPSSSSLLPHGSFLLVSPSRRSFLLVAPSSSWLLPPPRSFLLVAPSSSSLLPPLFISFRICKSRYFIKIDESITDGPWT